MAVEDVCPWGRAKGTLAPETEHRLTCNINLLTERVGQESRTLLCTGKCLSGSYYPLVSSYYGRFFQEHFNKISGIHKNNITYKFSFINLEMITELLLGLTQESSLGKSAPSYLPVAHLSPASLASGQALQRSQCLPLDLCTC